MPHLLLFVLSLIGVTALGACSAFEPDKAAVSDSTLVEVLVDFHIAGSRERLGHEGPEGLRDSILALHGVEEEAFRASIDYYAEHPDEYVDLYRDVLDRIVSEQSRLGEWMRRQGEPDTTSSPIAE